MSVDGAARAGDAAGRRREPPTALTAYQKRLFVLLGGATFFEGYDIFALAQILPNLRADMDLKPTDAGMLVAVTSLGTVLAYALVHRADRWGRCRVLTIAIVGYALLSLLTAGALDLWTFAGCQLAARVFLIAEYSMAMVYAAEEYPADRRGMVIGVIQACSSFGAVTCAAVVPLLLRTAVGWRSVYLVGTLPLLFVVLARRELRETDRFTRLAVTARGQRAPLRRILSTPYRRPCSSLRPSGPSPISGRRTPSPSGRSSPSPSAG